RHARSRFSGSGMGVATWATTTSTDCSKRLVTRFFRITLTLDVTGGGDAGAMIDLLLLISANVFLFLLLFVVAQLARARRADGAAWEKLRARLEADDQRIERALREELRGTREETGAAFRGLREEVLLSLKG